MKKIIVAIDGYSSSGKSTMAKTLARNIGYLYIDSGAMYRAVTLYALENGIINSEGHINVAGLVKALPDISVSFRLDDATGQSHTVLNGVDVEKEIRSLRVAGYVSPVAAIKEVRDTLTALQRSYGKQKGIVMDGRDIGTTVFPDAEMKVFVDASPQIRAERRCKELKEKGQPASFEDVLRNVLERDEIDRTRKESPLRKAHDAHVLVNDDMTLAQQEDWLMDLYREIMARE